MSARSRIAYVQTSQGSNRILCAAFTCMRFQKESDKKAIFFRLRWNSHISGVQCERETVYLQSIPSAHAQIFSLLHLKSYYSLAFSLFLSRGVSQAKMVVALINCVISICYQYFRFEIFFSKIIFEIFFQTFFFPNIFQNLIFYFFASRPRSFSIIISHYHFSYNFVTID